jgi:branched-chain amino acid aminotransferase
MSKRNADRRAGQIWYDGRLAPWSDVQVHVLSHSLHYGSAVFEGERIYGGRVFKLSAHTERLIASAAHIGMVCPFDQATLEAATCAVVAANAISDGYVRPLCWLGDGVSSLAGSRCPVHVAIAAWEWPHAFEPSALTDGIRLMVSPWRRPPPQSAPHQAKAAGLYLLGMMSRRAAEARGYNDALMLDYRGLVAEATGANLFIVRGGTVVTPVADCILAGITRATVLHLARTLGYEVEERHVTAEQLRGADEVFLTGTAYEITPVRSIGDTTYRVGAMTRSLIGAFQQLVRPRHADGTSRSQTQNEPQGHGAPDSGGVRLNERGREPMTTELGA